MLCIQEDLPDVKYMSGKNKYGQFLAATKQLPLYEIFTGNFPDHVPYFFRLGGGLKFIDVIPPRCFPGNFNDRLIDGFYGTSTHEGHFMPKMLIWLYIKIQDLCYNQYRKTA